MEPEVVVKTIIEKDLLGILYELSFEDDEIEVTLLNCEGEVYMTSRGHEFVLGPNRCYIEIRKPKSRSLAAFWQETERRRHKER